MAVEVVWIIAWLICVQTPLEIGANFNFPFFTISGDASRIIVLAVFRRRTLDEYFCASHEWERYISCYAAPGVGPN